MTSKNNISLVELEEARRILEEVYRERDNNNDNNNEYYTLAIY